MRVFSYVLVLVLVGIAGFVLAMCVHQARAHEAPSGWAYDKACCSNKDCKPVDCGDIVEAPDGGWRYRQIHFDRATMKPSGDNQCHVCINSSGVTPFGMCLYLPWSSELSPHATRVVLP